MKRLTFALAVLTLAVLIIFVGNDRATPARALEPAQPTQAQPCGGTCSTSCMGGEKCSIGCPTGKAAHCDCKGVNSPHVPEKASCYCG